MKDKKLLKLQEEYGKLIPIIYIKGKRRFLEKPKRGKIKNYSYNNEEQIIVASLQKSVWWFNLLLLCAICIVTYNAYLYQTDIINVSYSKKITIQEDVISLNIMNEATSTREIFVSLEQDGEKILGNIKLEVGEGIGGLQSGNLGLVKGSHPMKLVIVVNTKFGSKRAAYDVVVVVADSIEN